MLRKICNVDAVSFYEKKENRKEDRNLMGENYQTVFHFSQSFIILIKC